MERPRILLVPFVTQLEWQIEPQLSEWADVASYDAPGVGSEPATEPSPDAVAARGIAEAERRGWTSCVVVADELGVAAALRLASARPDLVSALALGHACLNYREDGERPPLATGVNAALEQIARVDYRAFAHAMTQGTLGAYGDDVVQQWIERVPQERALAAIDAARSLQDVQDNRAALAELDVPLLLAQHVGCLGWTAEGFEDAVAAFPHADVVRTEEKPSVSREFADALRRLCGA